MFELTPEVLSLEMLYGIQIGPGVSLTLNPKSLRYIDGLRVTKILSIRSEELLLKTATSKFILGDSFVLYPIS